jgi:uncharacterized protein with HEPN domain
MEADQLGRLRDILESARLIGTYVKDMAESDFRTDMQKQDAVIRRIESSAKPQRTYLKRLDNPSPNFPFAKCAACGTSWRTTMQTWI